MSSVPFSPSPPLSLPSTDAVRARRLSSGNVFTQAASYIPASVTSHLPTAISAHLPTQQQHTPSPAVAEAMHSKADQAEVEDALKQLAGRGTEMVDAKRP